MNKVNQSALNWHQGMMKVGLVTALLARSALPVSAADDFGADVVEKQLRNRSMQWFGIEEPLDASAPPTSGPYRTPAQGAGKQVLLAEGLRAEYVTRMVGDAADQFAFWPSDENPTHLIFCIEGSRQDLGTLLPGGFVQKFNPGVQRVRIRDGEVDTIVRGTDACDGIRRTAWGTILFTEERTDGGAYEILNPLQVTNHTITDRTLGNIVDQNGLPSVSIVQRTALPTIAWEGIAVLPSGVILAGDELRPGTGTPDADGGAIFKFIPAVPRTSSGPISNLNESPLATGNVYALRMSCITGVQYGQGCEIGTGAWIAVGTPTARADADKLGATGYYRPEDLELDEEYSGEGVRFCWTNTGDASIANYGEVLCGIDRTPLVADSNRQTVTANRFVEGDADFNQPDNFAFQPKTHNHYVIEDNPNGDIFACLPDGADRDIKTDGCVKILSVRDSSAEPTGFKFSSDGKTAYVSIQHSNDMNMPKVDDYGTDDILKITGFKTNTRSDRGSSK
ncbi:hypothetical protein W02_17700 [Nitrospira sp. KM1]|uniref:alkaline phosphatase PhoX n=1 Tax=Nitrospira sp. KM1 TaxID=1936990 RepID=UPI0013A74939|nr:alkaline phosphatase PhoX [Nitrospira sp. KM1]BCA54630.1 hypothetical protein W02_17700 [Nitrospira sp. KM1]